MFILGCLQKADWTFLNCNQNSWVIMNVFRHACKERHFSSLVNFTGFREFTCLYFSTSKGSVGVLSKGKLSAKA